MTTSPLFPQLSATLTIPFWQWFLTRFGKKTAVYVGISVSGCTELRAGASTGMGGLRAAAVGLQETNPASVPLQSAVPFLITVVVLDSNLVVTYIVAVAAGISVAAAFLLPW